MRLRYSIFPVIMVALISSCLKVEELEVQDVKLEEISFEAVIDHDSDTKTVLDGEVNDKARKVLWTPGDEITVFSVPYAAPTSPVKFQTDIEEPGDQAVFTGYTSFGSTYWAVYPYNDGCFYSYYNKKKSLVVTVPSVQSYNEDTFDPEAALMLARNAYGEKLNFKNLCGIFALQLTGEEKVQSVAFIGRDASGDYMQVSGTYVVDMTYESVPEMNTYSGEDAIYSNSMTLQCDEPVQLSATESTPFYFVLPPARYESFVIQINTDDGKIMFKEGNKPLVIQRSDIAYASSLSYVENVYIDLSETGTSNCYIVPEAGLYSFDASIIGTGQIGLIEGAGFHTDNVTINPASVDVIWADRSNLVSGLELKDKKVLFTANGLDGNLLIAARDDIGNIIWSWHIWITKEINELIYRSNNGYEYKVLDRNIGAIKNTWYDGKTWVNAVGAYFQWGRKDPFLNNLFSSEKQVFSVLNSIASPNVLSTNNYVSYQSSEQDWMNPVNTKLWHKGVKTIYDPCPAGYKVINEDVLNSVSLNSYLPKVGYDIIYDGTNCTYFPCSGFYTGNGDFNNEEDSFVWTSTHNKHLSISGESLDMASSYKSVAALPVRCMRDELPYVELLSCEELSSSSLKIHGLIKSPGASDIIECGIVYSLQNDMSDAVRVVSNMNTSEFVVEVNGLEAAKEYYIMTYATNSEGTMTSDMEVYITPHADGSLHLSADGCANSYIVTKSGQYSFDAVRGNNQSSIIGNAHSVEVLWETMNTDENLSVGDIIKNAVYLDVGRIAFEVSSPFVEGNALIAVKDVNDDILWSWHIWVTDMPQECVYSNGVGTMMDRNLGATSTTIGDVRALGLLYQWGRKDPFLNIGAFHDRYLNRANWVGSGQWSTSHGSASISLANEYPMAFYKGDSDWLYQSNNKLWASDKTLYDPCPYGWRVPDVEIWYGAASIAPEYDAIHRGLSFDERLCSPSTWYPASSGISNTGSRYFDSGNYWSINCFGTMSYGISFNSAGDFEYENLNYRGCALSVRCMKDE